MKLSNIKIQSKVLIIICIPLFSLLAAIGVLLVNENYRRLENTQLYELTSTAPGIGNFLQELQRERASSVQFINAKGDTIFGAQDRLVKQRNATDAALPAYQNEMTNILNGSFDTTVKDAIKGAQSKINELVDLRKQVDIKAVDGNQTAKFYTETNSKIIEIISRMASLSTDAAISMQLIGYYNLVLIKEKSGIERAIGANGIGQGMFTTDIYARLVGLSAQQDVHFAVFKERANPDVVKFYEATVTGPPVDEVLRLRKVIFSSGTGTAIDSSLSSNYWIDMTTQRIDLLRKVEKRDAEALISLVEATKNASTSRFFTELGLSAMTLLITVIFSIYMVRSITGPLSEANNGLQELANDNLDYQVVGDMRKDEIGDIARAMLVFKRNAIERRHMTALQEDENKAKLVRAARIESLINTFDSTANKLIRSLEAAATEMDMTSQSMLNIANQTSAQSSVVAASAIQAGANVQNVASAAEELSASIREIALQMSKSSDLADRALDSVTEAKETIGRLSIAGNKINQVVGLITEIAEQTNLLALNATIEAARAGDAGKGFAVVASEVKSLANQTQRATDDIAVMVRDVQEQTQQAVAVISNVGKAIADLNATTSAVAAAVEEQTSATQEISRNVQEAATGTDEVNSGITQVSDGARESGNAAGNVLTVSKELSGQSQQMKISIESFLTGIREV